MSGLAWIVLLLALAGALYAVWRMNRGDPYEPEQVMPLSPLPPSEFELYLREATKIAKADIAAGLPPRNAQKNQPYPVVYGSLPIKIRKEPELMADRITELRLDALEQGKPLDPAALLKEAQELLSKGPYYVYSGVNFNSCTPNYTRTTDVDLANDLIKLVLKNLEKES